MQKWPVGGSIALNSLSKRLTAIIEVCGYAALKKISYCPWRSKNMMITCTQCKTLEDKFTSSPTVFFVTNKIIHGGLQGGRADGGDSTRLNIKTFSVLMMRVTGTRALHSPAWAASPFSASCRRRERLDLPGRRVGQSPWPADPAGSEPETKPRTPGRTQTHVPERFPHSPASFPTINEKRQQNWSSQTATSSSSGLSYISNTRWLHCIDLVIYSVYAFNIATLIWKLLNG